MTGPNGLNFTLRQLGRDSHLLNKQQITAFAEDKPFQRLPSWEVHPVSSRSLYLPTTKRLMARFLPISGPVWAPSLFPLTCRMSQSSIHLYDEAPPFPYKALQAVQMTTAWRREHVAQQARTHSHVFPLGTNHLHAQGPWLPVHHPSLPTTQISPLLHSQGWCQSLQSILETQEQPRKQTLRFSH